METNFITSLSGLALLLTIVWALSAFYWMFGRGQAKFDRFMKRIDGLPPLQALDELNAYLTYRRVTVSLNPLVWYRYWNKEFIDGEWR